MRKYLIVDTFGDAYRKDREVKGERLRVVAAKRPHGTLAGRFFPATLFDSPYAARVAIAAELRARQLEQAAPVVTQFYDSLRIVPVEVADA